jgi:hypothetical protein
MGIAFRPAPIGERYVAIRDGAHESPEVVTSAGAVANFTILGDTAIQYELQFARLKDPWSAGLYSAGPGRNGFKSLTLCVGVAAGEYNGLLAQGLITNKDTLAGMTVKEVIDLMRKKQAYVEIRTAAHPSGEIRSNVVPAEEWEKKLAVERVTSPPIY